LKKSYCWEEAAPVRKRLGLEKHIGSSFPEEMSGAEKGRFRRDLEQTRMCIEKAPGNRRDKRQLHLVWGAFRGVRFNRAGEFPWKTERITGKKSWLLPGQIWRGVFDSIRDHLETRSEEEKNTPFQGGGSSHGKDEFLRSSILLPDWGREGERSLRRGVANKLRKDKNIRREGRRVTSYYSGSSVSGKFSTPRGRVLYNTIWILLGPPNNLLEGEDP